VIRQIGPQGQQDFATTLVGKTSPVNTILLTNVGNDTLLVSKQILGGANPTAFVPDPATTSCNWANGLPSGESCQLGYTCRPKSAGVLTATVTLVDNTSTFQNVLNLACEGLTAPVTPTVVITVPSNGSVYTYGTTVPVTVDVENGLSIPTPPTGTITLTLTDLATKAVTTLGPFTLYPAVGGFSSTGTSLPGLHPAGYTIVAKYSGDTVDAAATSAADTFTVSPQVPTIAWPTPSFVYTGTKLSATQLDAVASAPGFPSLPGTYVYNPPAGTLENTEGSVTLKVTFTPTDAVDYTSASDSVQLEVLTQPTIAHPSQTALVSKANPVASGAAVELNASVKSSESDLEPTGTVTVREGGKVLATANLAKGEAALSVKGLGAGTHVLTAEYSGSSKLKSSTSEPLKQVVVTVGGTSHRDAVDNKLE
jgi:hypothetical protein